MSVEVASCPICGSEEALPLLDMRSARMVRCGRCGLVYRDPLRPAGSLASQFAGEPANLVLEERVGERRSRHFRRFLRGAGRPGKLLDLGCGYGFFLKLAQEAGWDAIGVDPDPRAVTYAKDRLHVNALEGDLRAFHFPAGSFDLVTAWNALDFVPDPLDVLKELHRVLKPGRRLFIRTPNATWQLLNFRLLRFAGRLGCGVGLEGRPRPTFVFHQTSFSRSTLRLVIERAGFVAFRIRNSPPVKGDPYLGLGSGGEMMLSLVKLGVHGLAQSVSFLSGSRWLVGASLEACAWREG